MQSANVTSQVEHQQRREAKNWPFLLADYVAILGEKSVRFDRLRDRLLFCSYVKNHKHVAGNYAYFSLLFMEIFCDPPCFLCHKSHVQLARKLPGYVVSGLIAFWITRWNSHVTSQVLDFHVKISDPLLFAKNSTAICLNTAFKNCCVQLALTGLAEINTGNYGQMPVTLKPESLIFIVNNVCVHILIMYNCILCVGFPWKQLSFVGTQVCAGGCSKTLHQ